MDTSLNIPPRSDEHIVYFDGLTKRYGSLTAVDGLSFGVPQGALFGFLGANGAGKSTTLKMLMGLIRPSSGTFHLFGQEGRGRTRLRADVGALIEQPAFYDHLSGRANLRVFARLSGSHVDEQGLNTLLEAVGLLGAARRRVVGYSQGMRQRLGLAQALVGSPRLLVLDEPTNGLDPEGSREIWTLLRRQVNERGVTILISSHLLHEVEEACDVVAIIDQGRLVRYDSVSNLLRGAARRVAVEFIDEATATRAREAIKDWKGVEADRDTLADAASTKLVVNLVATSAAEFNQRLNQQALAFHFIQPADRTLKDYFLRLRDNTGKSGGKPVSK